MDFDLTPWPAVVVVGALSGGRRNSVWEGRFAGYRVVIRRSRRSQESLRWELSLLEHLATKDFLVPTPIPTLGGELQHNSTVVQHWIEGTEPTSHADWCSIASELRRLHEVCSDWPRRPETVMVTELREDSCSLDADLAQIPASIAAELLGVFSQYSDVPISVIHGDPSASNLRIASDGRVGLLDWDESRVDVTWHDLSNLGIEILGADDHRRALRLSHAWEAANAWLLEPEYALRRLAALRESR